MFKQPFNETDPESNVEVSYRKRVKPFVGATTDECYTVKGPYLLVEKLLRKIKGEEDEG